MVDRLSKLVPTATGEMRTIYEQKLVQSAIFERVEKSFG